MDRRPDRPRASGSPPASTPTAGPRTRCRGVTACLRVQRRRGHRRFGDARPRPPLQRRHPDRRWAMTYHAPSDPFLEGPQRQCDPLIASTAGVATLEMTSTSAPVATGSGRRRWATSRRRRARPLPANAGHEVRRSRSAASLEVAAAATKASPHVAGRSGGRGWLACTPRTRRRQTGQCRGRDKPRPARSRRQFTMVGETRVRRRAPPPRTATSPRPRQRPGRPVRPLGEPRRAREHAAHRIGVEFVDQIRQARASASTGPPPAPGLATVAARGPRRTVRSNWSRNRAGSTARRCPAAAARSAGRLDDVRASRLVRCRCQA